VLLIGSGEEYGAVKPEFIPINESVPLAPGNIYAATKSAMDMFGEIYYKAYGLQIIRVRAFNHIGPGQSSQFVVSDFCKQVAMIEAGKTDPVLYVGNLSAKRDFTDVRDVVKAYALLCEKGETGQVYNIGTGNAVSIQSILDTILDFSSSQISVKIDKNKFRPVDVPIIEPDISKLVQTTNWSPKFDIKDTILSTLGYWRMQEL
jgi:GDP-4-dehydro-6-deoxy-D-mannose reductase